MERVKFSNRTRINFLILIIILILSFVPLSSQTDKTYFDTKGKDFWLTFPPNYHSGKQTPRNYYDDSLYIYITADKPTIGIIEYIDLNGNSYTHGFNIPDPTKIHTFSLFYYNFELLGYNDNTGKLTNRNNSEVITKQYFHITSDNEVTVYAHNQAYTTSDACLVFPTDVLGRDYFIISYNSDGVFEFDSLAPRSTPSQFVILATENNTNVTIIPKVETQFNNRDTQNVTMNKGEAYLVQAKITSTSLRGDLTGSEVHTDKPVAVFAGHQRSTLPNKLNYSAPSRDYLLEQMPQVETWGNNALLIPFEPPLNMTQFGNDIFRILSANDSTEIYIDSVLVSVLNRGEFYEDSLTYPALVTANAPVLVSQFKKTTDVNGSMSNNMSDPFEMLIPPVEQFMTDYRVINIQACQFSKSQIVYTEQYIIIVAPDTSINSVLLDGNPIQPGNFKPIPSSHYYYSSARVNDGLHTVSCTAKVGVYVYGYGQADSYGYVGGMSMVPVRYRNDTNKPVVKINKDSCNSEADITISDSTIVDLGLFSVDILDTINCRLTIENYLPKYEMLKITVINPYRDAIYNIIATDSAGLVTDIRDTIQGFTIEFPEISSSGNIYEFDTTYVGVLACDSVKIKNTGLFPITFDRNSLLSRNILFSLPLSQLPLTIKAGDSVMLKLCFCPKISDGNPQFDTLQFEFNCIYMKIYLTGIAEPIINNLNSKCNIPIKITKEEVPGYNFLEQNYPNPASSISTIRFGIADEGLANIKVYDLFGTHRMTLINEKLVPGIYDVKINTEELEQGVYFYTLMTGEFTISKSIIIRK